MNSLNGLWITIASASVYTMIGCSHLAPILPPQAQIAEKIVEAPNGVDISFNAHTCHAKNWNDAWLALGKMIRKEPATSSDGLCAEITSDGERDPASNANKGDK